MASVLQQVFLGFINNRKRLWGFFMEFKHRFIWIMWFKIL